jgi:acyl-CoA synthetase (NDP forming)
MRAGINDSTRRLASAIGDAARASGRTFVAYQYSALGGSLDTELLASLHAAQVPVLLGTTNTMRTLRYLPIRRRYWLRAATASRAAAGQSAAAADLGNGDEFLSLRQALVSHGIPIVDAVAAHSGTEAAAAQGRFGAPVAVKAEAPSLIHKSDIGCVRLGCSTAAEAEQAYSEVTRNAGQAGFETSKVIVQPMTSGVAEAYAGIIDDPLYGPAVCFGLGGIFVEIFKDVRTEMAPLTHDEALDMIRSIKAAPILAGARGRQKGDVEALADVLVRLGEFALAYAGRFRALELNPIIVRPPGQGVVAVDIALDPNPPSQACAPASAAAP